VIVMMFTRALQRLSGIGLLLVLAGCGGGAVVFAPTPPPPDLSPERYDHPSGAFSISLPRTWALYEQNTTVMAGAAFSAPNEDEPALQIAAVDLGAEIDAAAFGDLISRYQSSVRPDVDRYREQSRQAMGDGSWRMTGLRTQPGGMTQQVNTFLQRAGSLISVIEVVIPNPESAESAARTAALQTIVNSFMLQPEAQLEPADLPMLAFAKNSSLGILHVSGWSTSSGVFFITGELANYGPTTIDRVPVEASLLTADGLVVAGAVDSIMGHGIPPGGFAPFSLRFGQGQPALSATYTLTAGKEWQPGEPVDLFPADMLTWADESAIDAQNRLIISGTVTNTGSAPARQLRASATVFDEHGSVIGATYVDLVPELEPDAEAPYKIIVSEFGGVPVNYIVNIQGLN
jgi:hypothetical protein